mgnify:CR=1 FL=1
MKRFWKYVTGVVPAYGLFPLVFSFVFNCLVYSGSRAIAGGWYHHNIESNLDLRLPFVPQFLIIYFGCYVFWAVNYILAARQEREQVYRFFTADIISRCVCLIIFLAYPTTNTRPVIEGNGIWDLLAGWLYSIDAADNLFPSIHCLVSWFCFLGIKDQKRIPTWYKGVSFTLAVLVFLSTIFTKQLSTPPINTHFTKGYTKKYQVFFGGIFHFFNFVPNSKKSLWRPTTSSSIFLLRRKK